VSVKVEVWNSDFNFMVLIEVPYQTIDYIPHQFYHPIIISLNLERLFIFYFLRHNEIIVKIIKYE
jgi:hypothetical protein